MAGRKILGEAEAWSCLEAAAASGEARSTWARRHGIDGRSLNAWRVNLERSGRAARSTPELRLVELVARGERPLAGPACRVRCGSFVVEVEADFDAAVLTRVLAAVAAC